MNKGAPSFVVDDYYDLLALHRVFMEAKFNGEPNDADVSGSPIVAAMHARLLESLIAAAVKRSDQSARASWEEWLVLEEPRREWRIALQRAVEERRWSSWSEGEKRDYVLSLLSPFSVTEALVQVFIENVSERQTGVKSVGAKSSRQHLSAAGNTEAPAYCVLRSKGYDIELIETSSDSEPQIKAARADWTFTAASCLELLGLVALAEVRGDNWQASDDEVDAFSDFHDQS